MSDANEKREWKAVYTIVERANQKHWIRIGSAFLNQDQSWNVKLDALPLDGKLNIREYQPYDPNRQRRAPVATTDRDPFAAIGVMS